MNHGEPLSIEQRKELAGNDLDAKQQERLLSLEAEGKFELLTFLNEQVLREQEIFWLRFCAFAAVHTGALVLVTSDVVAAKVWLAVIGTVLGLAWAYVQWISLKYADRPKDQYHWYRKSLGILWPYERDKQLERTAIIRKLIELVQRKPGLSSTDVGILIPIGITALWVIVAWDNW